MLANLEKTRMNFSLFRGGVRTYLSDLVNGSGETKEEGKGK